MRNNETLRPRTYETRASKIAIGLAVFFLVLVASIPTGLAEPISAFDLAFPKGVNVSLLVIAHNGEEKPLQALPFDVAPDGLPMFAEGRTFAILGSIKKSVSIGGGPISDFAWMRDGTLSLITQGRVATFSDKGLYLGPRLPHPGMRIRVAGDNGAYVFGGQKEPDSHDVYLMTQDGIIVKLAELPLPAVDVTGDGKTTYVAAGKTILRVAEKSPASVVLRARDDITSVAWAPNAGLFYATRKAVGYIASNGGAYEFMQGNAGLVRVQGDSVFVLLQGGPDSRGPQLIRFRPAGGFGKISDLQSKK